MLKKELLHRLSTYRMKMEDVKLCIFHYISTYYNRKRIHTNNPQRLSQAAYRSLKEEKIAIGHLRRN